MGITEIITWHAGGGQFVNWSLKRPDSMGVRDFFSALLERLFSDKTKGPIIQVPGTNEVVDRRTIYSISVTVEWA